jgi:hypothetical protein
MMSYLSGQLQSARHAQSAVAWSGKHRQPAGLFAISLARGWKS